MNDATPTDGELLKRIGLTDADLRDMQTKFAKFVENLNPAQKRSLAVSEPTAAEAAATLGDDVTPERLQQFISERAHHSQPIVLNNRGGEAGK